MWWRSKDSSSSAAPVGASRTVTAFSADDSFGTNAIITSKYTAINLLPFAIKEQFRRISNFYFLIIAAISLVPGISPVSWMSTSLPLLLVVSVGMARDVYEDFQRKKSDRKGNRAPISVVEGTTVRSSLLMDLRVGEVVRLAAGDAVPADIVPLTSSGDGGVVYVSTSGLDGESSLKQRLVPQAVLEAGAVDGVVVSAAAPVPALESFTASVGCGAGGVQAPLDDKNLLPRGSVLRNTATVDALIVYTGVDTKVSLNMRSPPSKMGAIEKMLNRVVMLMFASLLFLVFVFMIWSGVSQYRSGEGQWYMGDYRLDGFASTAFRGFGTYIILFHTFIPVSMFITLEVVRFIQGIFIFADVKMRSQGTPVIPKAGNLHEVLGNIEHVLTDKTGTLTKNIMRFVAASTGGNIFDIRKSRRAFQTAVDAGKNAPARELVLAMALCHAVVPEKVPKDESVGTGGGEAFEYNGQSPDEVALVEAARDYGIPLTERRLDQVVLGATGSSETEAWRLLAEIEFNSDRKRMSVVVEEVVSGRKYLFTKGADAVMVPLLRAGEHSQSLKDDLHTFAVDGLRTLIFGRRELTDAACSSWMTEWTAARNLLEGRAERQAELGARLEGEGLEYVGCTAVEDRLQERVPETVEFLREAGVRIWVLTGDKLETAENIGYSASLLSRKMHVQIVRAASKDELRTRLTSVRDGVYEASGKSADGMHHSRKVSSDLTDFVTMRSSAVLSDSDALVAKTANLAIIIEGSSLMEMEGDEELEQLFMDVSDVCSTVICARVTPSQKAKMVRMTRRWRCATTLAIGDGGNDVSMIQEAHIGVGIVGKEGTQASLAADYSMGEFKHLQRLLSVHGRYSYVRSAGVINLSLYKNVAFSCTQLFFQFFCFVSGTSVHDQWVLTGYNAIITLAGPFLYGIFERDLDEATIEAHPQVYLSNRNNRLFSYRTVAEHTLAYSIWHGLVCFFGIYFMFGRAGEIAFINGRDTGFTLTGFAVSVVLVLVVQFKFFLSSHIINKLVLAGLFISFGFVFLVLPMATLFVHQYEVEGLIPVLLSSLRFHLAWPLILFVALVPDFLVLMYRQGILGAYDKDQVVAQLQREESALSRKVMMRSRARESLPEAGVFSAGAERLTTGPRRRRRSGMETSPV